jgi:hypothetical protein
VTPRAAAAASLAHARAARACVWRVSLVSGAAVCTRRSCARGADAAVKGRSWQRGVRLCSL